MMSETFQHWMQRGEDREAAFNWIVQDLHEDRALAEIRFEKFIVLLEEECFLRTYQYIGKNLLETKPSTVQWEGQVIGPEFGIELGPILKELRGEEERNA